MATAYIVDAVRTAGGRRGGRLAGVHPVDLLAKSLDGVVGRSGIDPSAVDDVVTGWCSPPNCFLNPPRRSQSTVNAVPHSKPSNSQPKL